MAALRSPVVVVAAMFLLALPPVADAQIKSCGDMELFIANPDMRQTAEDGKYHVAGDFFMQFQVQGEGASDVEIFAFSVGLPVDNPEEICDAPVWPAGLMLEAYKADFEKTDGFFILMNTRGGSTPQHLDLSVAVHAYDADGNEVARFWTTAVVENCDRATYVSNEACSQEQATQNDRIMPWPVILPGDGSMEVVEGVAIEFAEPLQPTIFGEDGVTTTPESGLRVFLNNQDITAELADWPDRPRWDRDTFYDHGPRGTFSTVAPPCQDPEQEGVKSCGPADGPALQWTGRPMTPDDVLRVEAIDLAGNVAVKEIHMAQAAAGGTLEGGIPILEMHFDEHEVTAAPGETAVFEMTMENTGSGEGHPFSEWLPSDHPAGWPEPMWMPGHEPVPPKGASQQELHVTIPEDAVEGLHDITARMNYKQAGLDKSTIRALTVIVATPEGGEVAEDLPPDRSSPAIRLLPLLLLGLVAARISKRT